MSKAMSRLRRASINSFSSTRMREVSIARRIISFSPIFFNLRCQPNSGWLQRQYFQFGITIGTIKNFSNQHSLYGNLSFAFWTVCHVLFSSLLFFLALHYNKKSPSSSSEGRTKSVGRGSRGTTFIRYYLTIVTLSSTLTYTPARSRGPPAEVYSHLTGDFFSQLPGFIHSPLTYGLSTSRPLSVRNRYLLLVPSTLFAMQLYKCLKIYNMDGFSLSRFLRKIQQIHHQNISLVQ